MPLLVLPLDFDHVSPHLDLQLLRREMLHVQADGKLVVVQVHLMAKQFGLGKKALYLSGSLEIPDTKHFHVLDTSLQTLTPKLPEKIWNKRYGSLGPLSILQNLHLVE
ncbi:hypothetical protein E2320_007202, partial [Naja naja]